MRQTARRCCVTSTPGSMCGRKIRAAKQEENEMRNMKKLVSLCLVFALTLSLGFPSGRRPGISRFWRWAPI